MEIHPTYDAVERLKSLPAKAAAGAIPQEDHDKLHRQAFAGEITGKEVRRQVPALSKGIRLASSAPTGDPDQDKVRAVEQQIAVAAAGGPQHQGARLRLGVGFQPVRIILLLMVIISLAPASVGAQSAVERVAERATTAHDTYCAEVAATENAGDAAQALVEVGEAWAEVARVQEATGNEWLLYWVGVLARCLSQDDRAAEALIAFLESDTATEGLPAMEQDARKRLMRLRPDYLPPNSLDPEALPTTPDQRRRSGQIAGGVVLAIGAAGAGTGSAAGFAGLAETHSTLTTATHSRAEVDGLLARGDGQAVAGIGLAAGATAAIVASIAAIADASKAPQVQVGVLAAPLASGVALTVGGRW